MDGLSDSASRKEFQKCSEKLREMPPTVEGRRGKAGRKVKGGVTLQRLIVGTGAAVYPLKWLYVPRKGDDHLRHKKRGGD